MKLAIMQPYFLPYIGYFQLISSVDLFILYDNLKYTKKGWINRNRILQNNTGVVFSLPLKKASDSLNIIDRHLSPEFSRRKLLNKFIGAYRSAPYFDDTCKILESILNHPSDNLFQYIYNSVVNLCGYLGVKTKIQISSELDINHELRGKEKVLEICKYTNCQHYINASGGTHLYSKEEFLLNGINLQFIKPRPLIYNQYSDPFVPWLSIIDVLMFNPLSLVHDYVQGNYDLS